MPQNRFNFFREYVAELQKEELRDFIEKLERLQQRFRWIRNGAICSFSLGVLLFIFVGKVLPYYNMMIFHGWMDYVSIAVMTVFTGIPVLLFLLFLSCGKRLRLYLLQAKLFYEHFPHASSYLVLFNGWGQIEKTLRYFEGGWIATCSSSGKWFAATIEYRESRSSSYDLLNKRQRYSAKSYAYSCLFEFMSNERNVDVFQQRHREKMLSGKIPSLSREEVANQFGHLPRAKQADAVNKVISDQYKEFSE